MMTAPLAPQTLRICGGATLPQEGGGLTVTWPLARAHVNGEGFELEIRPHWVLSIAHSEAQRTRAERDHVSAAWACTWTRLERVFVARRSVVLQPKDGPSCRFVALTRRRLQPVIRLLDDNNVPIERVATTVGRAFTI